MSGIGRSSNVVVVVVRAAKQISATALTWALTNVVQPGDCVRLLVVIPIHTSSKLSFFALFEILLHHNYSVTKCSILRSEFMIGFEINVHLSV